MCGAGEPAGRDKGLPHPLDPPHRIEAGIEAQHPRHRGTGGQAYQRTSVPAYQRTGVPADRRTGVPADISAGQCVLAKACVNMALTVGGQITNFVVFSN